MLLRCCIDALLLHCSCTVALLLRRFLLPMLLLRFIVCVAGRLRRILVFALALLIDRGGAVELLGIVDRSRWCC